MTLAQGHPDPLAQGEDSHLRNMNEIAGFHGYQLQGLDQPFGHVEQFIVDDQSWAIRYLVAETGKWWPGKRVLLAPQWTSWVSWPESKVYLDLDSDTVRRAPEYDPAKEITREYEEKLFAHYNREPYWTHRREAVAR
jgi:hypothetical protein